MSNESNLQRDTRSLSKNLPGDVDIRYRFDAPPTMCNLEFAKPLFPQQDLHGKAAVPNYGYRKQNQARATIPEPQLTAQVIKECQIAFSTLMKLIGNPAAVYRPRQGVDVGARNLRYSSGKELPHDTRTTLIRQMSITEFGMRWEPARQIFYGAGKVFANDGMTETVPTHDLAHLLVGACGNLPWCPEGSQEDVRLAEYYAVFLENIFDKVYGYVVARCFNAERVLHEAITYARWFVDVHYAPFPLPAEEAYRRFCWNMDMQAIIRLSPLFFALKRAERTFPAYRDQIWELHYNTADAPRPDQVGFVCPDNAKN